MRGRIYVLGALTTTFEWYCLVLIIWSPVLVHWGGGPYRQIEVDSAICLVSSRLAGSCTIKLCNSLSLLSSSTPSHLPFLVETARTPISYPVNPNHRDHYLSVSRPPAIMRSPTTLTAVFGFAALMDLTSAEGHGRWRHKNRLSVDVPQPGCGTPTGSTGGSAATVIYDNATPSSGSGGVVATPSSAAGAPVFAAQPTPSGGGVADLGLVEGDDGEASGGDLRYLSSSSSTSLGEAVTPSATPVASLGLVMEPVLLQLEFASVATQSSAHTSLSCSA